MTQESHGFITRDRIKPAEFKEIALNELKGYPSVYYLQNTVMKITKQSNDLFKIETLEDVEYVAERIILATGVQEEFPSVPNGLIVVDHFGRTSEKNVYAAGDAAQPAPTEIVLSEATGIQAAITINTDISIEKF